MKRSLKKVLFSKLQMIYDRISRNSQWLQERQSILLGTQLALDKLGIRDIQRLRETEFSVFSQWGEDGIIQYLIDKIHIDHDKFVEFGVENYLEANTRFLLLKDNWKGLVIDGSKENISFIKNQDLYWRHDLTAVSKFITAVNINQIINNAGFRGDIGLLSVDIDGNDYWVWDAIDVVTPRIVIAEYNGLWGPDALVSVPYDEDFVRSQKHHSNLYYGASLGALIHLGNKKGYAFVGSNSVGSNAFFVRRDVLGDLRETSAGEEYSIRKFREGRNADDSLSFSTTAEQLRVVADLPLIEVETGREGTVKAFIGNSFRGM